MTANQPDDARVVAPSVAELIASFAEQEPPFWSLGTPFVVDTPSTEDLVAKGTEAVPALIAALDSHDSKVVMYAAYCLGLIRDPSALAALEHVERRWLGAELAGPYDAGLRAVVEQAKDRLTH